MFSADYSMRAFSQRGRDFVMSELTSENATIQNSPSEAESTINASSSPEKEALISQILTLQDNLSSAILRVETARAAHSKLSEENVTMLEYINNLMAATQK